MSVKIYQPEALYTSEKLLEYHCFSVCDGVIEAVFPKSELATHYPDAEEEGSTVVLADTIVIPGLVNSHTHSFQSLLKGFRDDQTFFDWRDKALYRYAEQLTEEDIYTGALFAFGEMLLQGITTVCDFFYINDQGNDNVRAVIRAAKDLGIRLTLARTMYDWDGAPNRFQESVAQAVNNTEVLMAEFQTDSMIDVLPAPHSLHGASLEMIQAGQALAEKHGTMFHMHVAEGEYEREMILKKTGDSPVRYLEKQGVLTERLVMIHGVWLDEEEISLMASRQTKLSYNPSSNMFLGDGITQIKEMLEAGVTISLGTDGGCSNNRASIVDEMRMTSLLQKVVHRNSTVTTAESMLEMATRNGGVNLKRPVGELAPGFAADFVCIDLNDLSMQPRQNMLKNVVYSLQPSAFQAVYVGGRQVMASGQLLTVQLSDIVARVQATTRGWA